jgi:hypothetical protein
MYAVAVTVTAQLPGYDSSFKVVKANCVRIFPAQSRNELLLEIKKGKDEIEKTS